MRLSKIQVGGLIAAEAVEDSSMDTGSYALIEHHDENLQKIVERIIDLVGHIGISNETINDNISGAAEGANGMVLAIDASNQVTVSSKDNELGNRLSSMEKTIEALGTQMAAMTTVMEKEFKLRRLERGKDSCIKCCASIGCYYAHIPENGTAFPLKYLTKDLLLDILNAFMFEEEYELPDGYLDQSASSEAQAQQSKKQFRQLICTEIKYLIKREPRLEKKHGKWMIYYS